MKKYKSLSILLVALLICSFFFRPAPVKANVYQNQTGVLLIVFLFISVLTSPQDVISQATPGISPAILGDRIFKTTSVRMNCDMEWAGIAMTLNCSDGTNSFFADYQVAYIETTQEKGKSEKAALYVWGDYNSNIDGVQKNGLSSGFLSGTESKDSAGDISKVSLSGNLYGGIDDDTIFQTKVKVTLTPIQ